MTETRCQVLTGLITFVVGGSSLYVSSNMIYHNRMSFTHPPPPPKKREKKIKEKKKVEHPSKTVV
jgi:serine/threonine protein phosphatase PrpC